jgi:hypothetical protein
MWTQNRLHSSIVKEQTGVAFGAIPATEPGARRGLGSIYPSSLEVKIELGMCCSSAILTAANSSAILSGHEGQDRFELS